MPILIVPILLIVAYVIATLPKAAQAEVEAQKAEARQDESAAGKYRMLSTLALGGLFLLLILLALSAPLWSNLHP